MHIDEFEIPLSREQAACKNTIEKIQKFLSLMERKHKISTAEFMDRFHERALSPALKEDSEAWKNNYDSLLKWQEMLRQYEEMLHAMKISQPEKGPVVKVPFKKGS